MNVEILCTTEDPIDSLEHHTTLASSDFNVKVSTAFRPDKSLFIDGKPIITTSISWSEHPIKIYIPTKIYALPCKIEWIISTVKGVAYQITV